MSDGDFRSPKRALWSAVARGFVGRCPRCGRGRLFRGYVRPAPTCTPCGEDLTPYQTADFAPYLVVFFIGLVFTPLVLAMSLNPNFGDWALMPTLGAALGVALVLLPRTKGAAIGLLWALDVKTP